MQSALKIILVLVELIDVLIKRWQRQKHDEVIENIRNDPAGEFINEFGGVSDDASKASVPSSQAGVEVVHSERERRH